MKNLVVQRLADAAASSDADLARPALLIALLEYPGLDPEPYLSRLDRMGAVVRGRLGTLPPAAAGDATPAQIAAMNAFLFDEEGFAGNSTQYDDPRNSFLNQVLDRRTGIPISLALLYIEVGRRAGVDVKGVNFPGHFLLRAAQSAVAGSADLIVDPFHKGALLDERDCRRLLKQHLGRKATLSPALLAPATKPQILARMLLNLKRLYIAMRSFPQARDATELLLAVDPSALGELRDRGLISYHLQDFSRALRDLQDYLQLSSGLPADQEERGQLWEHVKNLRRRVAEMN